MKIGRIGVKVFLLFLITAMISAGFSPKNLTADQTEDWNQLLQKANSYFEQEQYEQAIASATQALEFAQKHFGEEQPQTITSLSRLAGFYNSLGYTEEALHFYKLALPLAQKIFGQDHMETLTLMTALGELYGDLGQYGESQQQLEKALAIMQQKLGVTAQETLNLMTSLAQIYQVQGDYGRAEELLQTVISNNENMLGVDHPDTIYARESLAAVYSAQGLFEQAEILYLSVLDQKTANLEEKDPERIISRIITISDLAELYRKMGLFAKSEPLFLQAMKLFKEVLGDQDSDLYQTMGNLAQLYQDQGLYPQAESLYEEVWEFDRKTIGEKHPNTIIDLNNLAGIYRLQGLYGKSEAYYQKALTYIKEALGEKHPETISMMNNLALLYENEGLFDQSEPLFKTALRYSQEVLGEEHPTTLALMNNLASLYESQGVFDKSEPLYAQTIQLNEKVYGPDHPNTIAAVNNLGYLYLIQKQFDKADPLFSTVLKTWDNQLGERHQKTLKALNNLARVYHQQGKTDQAEEMFLKALRLRKEVLGDKHPDVVRSMVDLAGLYRTQGKLAEAETLLLKTITLAEEVLGDKHQYTFEALNSLAELYESSGKLEKSLAITQKGFDRRTKFLNQVLWAAGENTRQSYIELHKPEQDRFVSLVIKVKKPNIGRLALHISLQRKGLLLKISSEIQKIVEMTKSSGLAAIAEKIDKKRKQLASMTLSGPTTETPEEFRKTIYNLENELDELQAELGRASKIYQITARPISVDQVFENLSEEDVLVDFIAYNDGVAKIVALVAQSSPENQIELVPLGDLESIRKVIAIYRETIQDEEAEEDDILVTGQEAYNAIWRPLESFIGEKTSVYIVPDSALHLLPFDALIDEDDNYLIESKDLKILSSSRDLVVASLPSAKGVFMILAGPDYDLEDLKTKKKKQEIAGRRGGVGQGLRVASHGLRSLSFDPLLGAELEGETIKKVFDSFAALRGAENEGKNIQQVAQSGNSNAVIFLKSEAEEQKLRNIQKPPQMLHIATHGFFLKAEERLKKRLLSLNRGGTLATPPPGDNPLLRAGLAFAGINSNAPFLGEIDTDNDGVLTALEVLGLPLSGTELVVLSACETGVGEIHAGEGVYGLRRAFQEAGVKSVVASLWPVSDEGTRRLMTAFYRGIFESLPIRKALKASQLALLNSEWSNPYYWASFVLVERRFTATY